MGQAGYLLRFVDIVLILLFGFICISSIKPSSVQPPESSEAPYKNIDPSQIVFVSIQNDGSFLVEDERRTLRTPAKLRTFLRQKRDALGRAEMKARLRSSQTAPIYYLMQAAKICKQLGIPKSIEVEINRSR
jgi:biopolymer transport protein ExbD